MNLKFGVDRREQHNANKTKENITIYKAKPLWNYCFTIIDHKHYKNVIYGFEITVIS